MRPKGERIIPNRAGQIPRRLPIVSISEASGPEGVREAGDELSLGDRAVFGGQRTVFLEQQGIGDITFTFEVIANLFCRGSVDD